VVPLPDTEGDLLLGVDPASPRSESELVLERGTTVLLFTDGLVERRGTDLDTGLARLVDVARELAGQPLDELCDDLIERLVQGHPEDDVALVALRLGC
jgi:serine phosphatase RsbU (regulator of sigma subunit)